MKNRVLSLAFVLLLALAGVVSANPKPIITVDGVAAATRLQPAARTAISKQVVALNAQLEKIRDRKPTDTDLKDIHEECMRLHNMIAHEFTAEQRHEFATYLHVQMAAAGIDVSKFAGHINHHQ